ncbi:MAG: hypothetical protein GXX96_24785 [Planctomycetaceae bacterium]|nr:hypothetical protein [Planctomycetaceae bacterium]
MIRALAIKELREIGWIVAIALAVYMIAVAAVASTAVESGLQRIPGLDWLVYQILQLDSYRSLPFVSGDLNGPFILTSLALALVLGFRQSVGEAQADTFGFLLHRPLGRRTILLMKLALAVGLLWLVSAIPILVLAWWAATPGSHPSPFEWSMTYPIWKTWAAMPVVYLGAFLSGLRPARWWGTRLVPLAAIAMPALAASLIPMWWFFSVPLAALAAVLLIVSILWVGETRDYS